MKPVPVRRYAHSGRFGWSLPVAPLAALGAAAVLGAGYGALCYRNPFPYVGVVLAATFGLGIGYATGWAGRRAHGRNVWLLRGVALIGALAGLYLAWAVFMQFQMTAKMKGFFSIEFQRTLLEPGNLKTSINALSRGGWFQLGRWVPTGHALFAIWGAEALVVAAGAVYAAGVPLRGRVYCEKAKRWCAVTRDAVRVELPAGDAQALSATIEDLNALRALPVAAPEATRYGSVNLHIARDDSPENAVTTAAWQVILIEHAPPKKDAQGPPGDIKNRRPLGPPVVLENPADYAALVDLARRERS